MLLEGVLRVSTKDHRAVWGCVCLSICCSSPAAEQGQCGASASTTHLPFLGAHDADSERLVDDGEDQQHSAGGSQQ